MIKISFTPEFLEWVAQQMRANNTGLDAQQFAVEFFHRAFVGRGAGPIGPTQVAKAAPVMLAALVMVQARLEESHGGIVAFTGEEWAQIDEALRQAQEAPIAAARGEAWK